RAGPLTCARSVIKSGCRRTVQRWCARGVGMFVQMKVCSLTADPFSNMPVVLLKEVDGRRAVPIWIGVVEAAAIATELEHIHLDRPTTHDLMKSMLVECEVKVERIEIHDLKNNVFYASVHLHRPDGGLVCVDARPSDAMALALRARAPIYVA